MTKEFSRRGTLGGLAAAALGLGPGGPLLMSAAQAQARGGTLTVGLTYDIDTLNVYSTGFLGDVQAAVVEGLLAPDQNAKYVPVLALEVPTLANGGIKLLDGGKMRVAYKLRPNVTWDDLRVAPVRREALMTLAKRYELQRLERVANEHGVSNDDAGAVVRARPDERRGTAAETPAEGVILATAIPPRPVEQFALPELTMTARIASADACTCARERVTGGACTRFCVNTAAAEAGTSETISATSSVPAWPRFLRPQDAAAKRKPRGNARDDGRSLIAGSQDGERFPLGVQHGQHIAFGTHNRHGGNQLAAMLLGAGDTIALDFFGHHLARARGKSIP